MAAMAVEGADQAPRLPMPSRNPLPLSASQEAQVRDIFHARVRSKCGPEIKGVCSQKLAHQPARYLETNQAANQGVPPAFAECAMGRTFTAPFACRETHRLMNGCMKAHATQEEQDAAREDWFAQRLQRQRERERKALRKAEQEAFLREWWGLPEKDRELARKEMEKMQQGERVAGVVRRDDNSAGRGQTGEGR